MRLFEVAVSVITLLKNNPIGYLNKVGAYISNLEVLDV